ncbi:MAG: exodeoxyribonuclease III [Pseudomonadota bacterium]
MKIASWNINGIKARLDNLISWLAESQPDIACLQEIKSVDEAFPREAIESAGYHVETHGQKGFNGVALLSKVPPDEVNRGLPELSPGDAADDQARFIEGVYSVNGGVLRVVSLYLPNGNPVETEKFPYKIRWMERLEHWAAERLRLEEPLVLAGDYNVIPEPFDCHDPQAWEGDALFRNESRSAFRRRRCASGFGAASGLDHPALCGLNRNLGCGLRCLRCGLTSGTALASGHDDATLALLDYDRV